MGAGQGGNPIGTLDRQGQAEYGFPLRFGQVREGRMNPFHIGQRGYQLWETWEALRLRGYEVGPEPTPATVRPTNTERVRYRKGRYKRASLLPGLPRVYTEPRLTASAWTERRNYAREIQGWTRGELSR